MSELNDVAKKLGGIEFALRFCHSKLVRFSSGDSPSPREIENIKTSVEKLSRDVLELQRKVGEL